MANHRRCPMSQTLQTLQDLQIQTRSHRNQALPQRCGGVQGDVIDSFEDTMLQCSRTHASSTCGLGSRERQ